MNLLPDERLLLTACGGTLTITTHRVRHEAYGTGGLAVTSIMLEALASASTAGRENRYLLACAAVAALGGLVLQAAGSGSGTYAPLCIGAGVALLLVLAFVDGRRTMLAFASAGATIRVEARRLTREQVLHLIGTAEAAKNERAFRLASHTALVPDARRSGASAAA